VLDIDPITRLLSAAQGAFQRGDGTAAITLLTAAPLVGGHPVLDLTALAPTFTDRDVVADPDSEAERHHVVMLVEQVRTHLRHTPSVWRTPRHRHGIRLAHAARATDDVDTEQRHPDVNPSLRYCALACEGTTPVLLLAVRTDGPVRVVRTPSGERGGALLHPGVRDVVSEIVELMLPSTPDV
jgi:hypothetical protein